MGQSAMKNFLSLDDFIALLPANLYQKDAHGVYIKCSDMQAQLFGYEKGYEIIGKTDYDFLDKVQADTIRLNDATVMSTKNILLAEEHVTLLNGAKLVYLSKKIPLLDGCGNSIGIIGVSVDVTEEKNNFNNRIFKIENEYKNYYENLIASLPGNVYWMNRGNVFLGCNDQQARLAGLKSRHEIVGKTNYDMPWKDQALILDMLNNEVMDKGISHVKEELAEMIIDGQIQERTFLSQKIPLYDDVSKVIGLLGISIDITDRKKAEEYRLKHEAAQKVIKFSHLVAGSIAHELKNPLGGIRQQMDTLRSIMGSNSKIPQKDREEFIGGVTERVIKTIDSTNYVIDGMLKKIRSFATGEVHHKEFKECAIDDDIENLLKTYPFEKNQRELIEVLYRYRGRFKYLGDSVLTTHVLGNLMKNALHAVAQTDKENAKIIIETKDSNECNLLIFKDTATGIPKDFVSKIFDQFETKKNAHGGSGLGLAFCTAVMQDTYGGDISCNSIEGEYTEFVLSFPKTKDA